MKSLNFSSKLFMVAFALLIMTNIVVLLGVYLNKSGEVTSEMTLTQRELKVPYYISKENNSMSLRVIYRVLNKGTYSHLSYWLDSVKLKKLGFDTDKYLSVNYKIKIPKKEVFIVLEYNGESYKKSLESAKEDLAEKQALYNANKNSSNKKMDYESAKRDLTSEKISASRLFAVDAGLDYDMLRQKYASKSDYMIVKGLVRVRVNHKLKTLDAYTEELSIEKIHLPYKFKHILKGIKPSKFYEKPKYKVKVKYGSRYEPWISSVKKY